MPSGNAPAIALPATPARPGAETSSFTGYASGSFAIAVLRQIIAFFPQYFYSPPLGKGIQYLAPQSVGYALFVARIVDVLSDPLVGWASDRTRHPWGKRLPWILLGIPLWLVTTVLLFTPPVQGTSPVNFVYLLVLASLYFIAETFVQVPYSAVLPEITRSEDEAVRLSSRMGRFFLAGVLLVLALGWLLTEKLGFAAAIVLFAVATIAPFAWTVRDLFRAEPRRETEEPVRFFAGVWEILRQRPMATYLGGHGLFVMGYYTLLVASPYFVTEIAGFSQAATGLFFLLSMVVAAASAPAVERLTLRFGKIAVMLAAMLLFAALFGWWSIAPALAGTRTVADVLGVTILNAANVRFGMLVQATFLFALAGLVVSVQMLVPNAIVADLVVYDERAWGRRREALLTGLQSGIEKNAVMAATLLASLVLSLGRDASSPLGITLIGPLGAAACVAGTLVFLLYPLGRGWQGR